MLTQLKLVVIEVIVVYVQSQYTLDKLPFAILTFFEYIIYILKHAVPFTFVNYDHNSRH